MPRTGYNLELSTENHEDSKVIAEQEETTVADLLRRTTKLLLFVRSIKQGSR